MISTHVSLTKGHTNTKVFYLRSVDLLFHDGDLLSEDGSIVLDHHSLLFHVSSSKQSQALETTKPGFAFVNNQRAAAAAFQCERQTQVT